MKKLLLLVSLALISLSSCSKDKKVEITSQDPIEKGEKVADFNCSTGSIRLHGKNSPVELGIWFSKEEFIDKMISKGAPKIQANIAYQLIEKIADDLCKE